MPPFQLSQSLTAVYMQVKIRMCCLILSIPCICEMPEVLGDTLDVSAASTVSTELGELKAWRKQPFPWESTAGRQYWTALGGRASPNGGA